MSPSLLSQLVTPTPSATPVPGEPFWSGAVIAAFVAAAVALAGSIVSVITQVRMSGRQLRHELRLDAITRSFTMEQQEIDRRLRQLNEFYGPLRMLRATSRRLRLSLPRETDAGDRWRLVGNIAQVKADPGAKLIVEAILEINGAIDGILIHKAGLMEGDVVPESFEKFMHHSRLLKLAWQSDAEIVHDPRLTGVADVPFPDEIDADIAAAVSAVQNALQEARQAAESAATEAN
jgi:hypothetical protein